MKVGPLETPRNSLKGCSTPSLRLKGLAAFEKHTPVYPFMLFMLFMVIIPLPGIAELHSAGYFFS